MSRSIAASLLALGMLVWVTGFATAQPAQKPDQHNGKEHKETTAKPGEGSHGDAHKGEHKSSTLFEFALEQSIWTLTVFILLLIVLRKFAWGPILEGLGKREEHIRLAVEEAKLARQETEKVREEFKAEMARAYAEIPKIMEEARKDAANLREEMKSKAASDIQGDRDRLRREIETARDQALQEIWSQAANIATLISAKAIGRSLTEEDHRRLNEEALAEAKGVGPKWNADLAQFGGE